MIREMQIRNYSERTVTTYVSLLSRLAKFYNHPVDQISIDQLKDYLHHRITNDKVSVAVVNQTISAYRILQKDVLNRDWEPVKVKRPRLEKKLPVVLSLDEIASLLNKTVNLKHRAIIALAYSSGMRRSEVKTIMPGHIDSERMRIHVVKGKGKKDRYTLLAQKTLELLKLYYRFEKPSTYLFEPRGKKNECLSDTTLNNIVKHAASRADLKKNISFHTLRHSFATHMLEKGINLRIIQQFMGHTSIKTTSVYLHIAQINPNSIASPLDSMDI
jgi:site-specific recombinase XerD